MITCKMGFRPVQLTIYIYDSAHLASQISMYLLVALVVQVVLELLQCHLVQESQLDPGTKKRS